MLQSLHETFPSQPQQSVMCNRPNCEVMYISEKVLLYSLGYLKNIKCFLSFSAQSGVCTKRFHLSRREQTVRNRPNQTIYVRQKKDAIAQYTNVMSFLFFHFFNLGLLLCFCLFPLLSSAPAFTGYHDYRLDTSEWYLYRDAAKRESGNQQKQGSNNPTKLLSHLICFRQGNRGRLRTTKTLAPWHSNLQAKQKSWTYCLPIWWSSSEAEFAHSSSKA